MPPFRPTTQSGARPVPSIPVFSLRAHSARLGAGWVAGLTGDMSHPTTPSGPGAYPPPPQPSHSATRETVHVVA